MFGFYQVAHGYDMAYHPTYTLPDPAKVDASGRIGVQSQ